MLPVLFDGDEDCDLVKKSTISISASNSSSFCEAASALLVFDDGNLDEVTLIGILVLEDVKFDDNALLMPVLTEVFLLALAAVTADIVAGFAPAAAAVLSVALLSCCCFLNC